MKQYKVTIANGNYPLIYTCDAISDAYECICTFACRAPAWIAFQRDDLLETLVQMRKGAASKIKGNGYSITVLKEADADANLD